MNRGSLVWYQGWCGEWCEGAARKVRRDFIAHYGLAEEAAPPLLRFDARYGQARPFAQGEEIST